MTVEEDAEGKRRWKAPMDARTASSGRSMTKKEKVRKKTLSKSSREWVDRQLRDPYVRKAQDAGYRARAAYKIKEIDEKFHVLKRGARVVDLGSAPGGWLQVVIETGAARVVGIDLLPVTPIGEATIFMADFTEPGMTEKLIAALGDKPTLVLSDMAAPATGHAATDHLRIMALAEAAGHFATEVLKPGGSFLCKVFQGGTERDLLELLKRSFKSVKHVKPPASRADSSELYVLATGFRG
jgi:23S rRNA (uridine2552-2'-O)-methyltransferase